MKNIAKHIAMGVLLLSSMAWAQSKFQPLSVKPGLWESTTTSTTTGQRPIPSEMLSQLSPDQRARMEARMNANSAPRTRTFTNKQCETKEKLAEQPFSNQKECKATVISSTATKAEIKMSCEYGDVKSTGTMNVEALGPENVKGSVHMTSSGGSHTMTVNTTFSGKWLGSSCGSTK